MRRPRSKLAGHLELLTHSLVSLARGRSLDTVTGSQTINSFMNVTGDLWLTSCALYAAELVNQFTPDDLENEAVYRLLLATLERLGAPAGKEVVLRYFELHLLDILGYRPELRSCVACKAPLAPEVNAFSPGLGGLLCPRCLPKDPSARPVSVNAQKVLKFFQGVEFASAARLKLDNGLARELETILGAYIRHILEREVKSVDWLNTLREQIRSGRLNRPVDLVPDA